MVIATQFGMIACLVHVRRVGENSADINPSLALGPVVGRCLVRSAPLTLAGLLRDPSRIGIFLPGRAYTEDFDHRCVVDFLVHR